MTRHQAQFCTSKLLQGQFLRKCLIMYKRMISLLFGSLSGFSYGIHDDASFNFSQKISLDQGNNTLEVLSMLIGVQNYGPWFDIQGAGIYSVILMDLTKITESLSSNEWTYQVGLEGESIGLGNISLANSSLWTQGTVFPINQTLIWYKGRVHYPSILLVWGRVKLGSMGRV